MKLNVKALGLAFGLTWGGTVLVLGIANVIWPLYGSAVLELAASIYPGYDATASFMQVVIGTLYGLVDGFIGGVIVGWLYNFFVPTYAD